ncbi:hypothetical protein L6475_03640 [Prevotella sp. E9-3]|uniref:hypothetical protein n=1 Tax=Prevotella sp. E9-3 TaxID=2913621 RepID=UPI001ED9F392|nr:hypothetical protein [Prevotella sp. E9-3]UKK49064.1 hypothetical protein L6475_03640 [Prevotella sp. E9-3]
MHKNGFILLCILFALLLFDDSYDDEQIAEKAEFGATTFLRVEKMLGLNYCSLLPEPAIVSERS